MQALQVSRLQLRRARGHQQVQPQEAGDLRSHSTRRMLIFNAARSLKVCKIMAQSPKPLYKAKAAPGIQKGERLE